MATPGGRMLTIDEVLQELSGDDGRPLARSTFYRWLHTGRGPRTVKLPNGKRRIRRVDLDAWLAAHEDAA
ncbi:MAG: helix-turn-helix domain-containing protein [Streptosporangiales bacterium]|nr:helix-turn-helix domain-containing protein [Streptosporangiales bacterium]